MILVQHVCTTSPRLKMDSVKITFCTESKIIHRASHILVFISMAKNMSSPLISVRALLVTLPPFLSITKVARIDPSV